MKERPVLEVSKAKKNNSPDLVEISFHAILGESLGATMKLKGTIRNMLVLILIDSGSTHNVITTTLIKELGLAVDTVGRTDCEWGSN